MIFINIYLTTFLPILIFLIIIFTLKNNIVKTDFNFFKNEELWFWGSIGAASAIFAQMIGNLLSSYLGIKYIESDMYNYYMFPLYAVVFAPTIEEIIFRKFLFRWLYKKLNLMTSAFISSLVFALLHFSVYGLIGYFLVGMVWCWIYYRTSNIWTTIIAHTYFNFLVIIMMNLKL